MTQDISTSGVTEAYDRLAPIYDLVFGLVFRSGRAAAVAAANRVGGKILEVGVGTGLSLAGYKQCTVVGIDISQAMLDKATRRVEALGLNHVISLNVMDAEHLAFPQAAFDAVVAQYVITAVPHPEKALDELLRVVRPGGEVIITTRIGAGKGLRGTIEKWLMPVTTRLGWRTEFPLQRYENWAATSGARMLEHHPIPPLGHFSLIRFVKPKPAEPSSPAAQAQQSHDSRAEGAFNKEP